MKQKNNKYLRTCKELEVAVGQSGAGGGIKLCARMGVKAKVYPPSEGRVRYRVTQDAKAKQVDHEVGRLRELVAHVFIFEAIAA